MPFRSSLLVSIICATVLVSIVTRANAITTEVAKKCQILREKQFPPRVIGNPAAGSAKGSSRDQLEFFRKCVANGGNMESTTEKIGSDSTSRTGRPHWRSALILGPKAKGK